MITPNDGKDMEKLDHSYIIGGNVKWSTLEISLARSLKLKNGLPIQPRSCTLGHLSQRNENTCLHKNLYPNVHSGFVHNIQKLETTGMPFSG